MAVQKHCGSFRVWDIPGLIVDFLPSLNPDFSSGGALEASKDPSQLRSPLALCIPGHSKCPNSPNPI